MRTITDIITLLLLTACGGHGNVQYADRQEATGADMIATLREVCSRYVGTDSPDSVTLAAILRLPDIKPSRNPGIYRCDRAGQRNIRRTNRAAQHCRI